LSSPGNSSCRRFLHRQYRDREDPPCPTGLCLAACRRGLRVGFFTAAALINKLEQAEKPCALDKFLSLLDWVEPLICDGLTYMSLSRHRVELLFRLLTNRDERSSVRTTRDRYPTEERS
jgi:DNA replication protein DnaC